METDSKYKPELDITLEKIQENIEAMKELAANKLLQVSNLKADQEGLFVGCVIDWDCFKDHAQHSCGGKFEVTTVYKGTSFNAAKKIVENYKNIIWMIEVKLETV